jgi:Ca2+-binding EF-hand superfamily protein
MTGQFIALIGAMGMAIALAGTPALAKENKTLKLLDSDNDGTVDLAEVKKAAGELFDKLNKDSDNTLDAKELKGHLSKKDLEAADPDKDGTLTKDEYLALVEMRFKAADPDNDGKLDAKELDSKAGKELVKLLK